MAATHAEYPPANASSSSKSTLMASLYVGDLHPSVTECTLYDAFSEFKSLISVRLCKDVATGRSLCYGYANFVSRQDANLAIKEKNNSMLNGKMIRVMMSVRAPISRRNGIGNVFVKNLPESIDNADLQDMFKKFGDIVSCKVATYEDGKSKGYGYVQFEKEDVASAAIKNFNGTIVADKEIYVGKFIRKTERVKPEDKYTNLYMKNLDADVSEDLLREKFFEFGNIVSLAIAKDENGTCKGYGFVNLDNPEDARRAVETLNGTQFGSKSLYVGRAQKKEEREQLLKEKFEEKRKEQMMIAKVSNLYVKNIAGNATEEELRKHFSQCGTITSAKIMCDEKGKSKGFGFVCFFTPEEAIDAVKTFHGHMFHGKPLYVAIAQRKEERKLQLQVQFGNRVGAGGSTSSVSVIRGRSPQLHCANTQSAGMVYQQYPPRGKSTNMIYPSYPTSQAVTYPPMIGNAPRKNMHNMRGRLNGNAVPYVPQVYQQSTQMRPLSTDFSDQQQKKSYGSVKEMNEEFRRRQSGTVEMQTQKLRERLCPLVEKGHPQLAAKITRMLMEMDNFELLVLRESHEYLAAKIDEACEVLKSKKKLTGSDTHRSYY